MSAQPQDVRSIRATTIIDKAERYVKMRGWSAFVAADKALPRDLLTLRPEDLRELVHAAIAQRVSARLASARYKDSDRVSDLAARRTDDLLGAMSEAVQQRAAVLARVAYTYDGESVSLLMLPIEGHRSLMNSAARQAQTHAERKRFHRACIAALRQHHADTIAALPPNSIKDLAALAEDIWG